MGDLFRVRSTWSGGPGGPPLLTTFYFGTSLYIVDDAVTATVAFFDACKAKWTNTLAVTVENEVAVIDDATGTLSSVEFATTGDTVTGENLTDPIPPANQVLIRLSTNDVVSGRQLRGRMNFPGITEEDSGGGKPQSGMLATLVGAMQDLVDDPGSELRVWSRTHGVSALVTGASAWSEFAVLRSRRD